MAYVLPSLSASPAAWKKISCAPRAARKQRLQSATVERSLLGRIRKNDVAGRTTWQRFPFVDVSAAEVHGILPTEVHGTRVLVDRHYTGLEPQDGSRPSFYLIQAERLIVGRVTPRE